MPGDLESEPKTSPEPRAPREPRATPEPAHTEPGFLPATPARREAESVFVRLIATAGVIGIGTLLGAILNANDVAGWIIGLVVSIVSVVLAAVLWRSRTL